MRKKTNLFLLLCLSNFWAGAQVQRTSVLEEFSTANCQYCPEGYEIIKKALSSHPNTIWLVHHAGFFTDDITIPASERLTFLYGTNAFAPAYMIDRTVQSETYTDYSPVWPISDSATISAQLDELAAIPCFTTVAINNLNYDIATRTVSATIQGQISGDFDANLIRLTIYLIEDSIIMPQASTTRTIQNYVHMHAVRDCVTNIFGDTLVTDSDGVYSYNLEYTVPQKAIASHCRLVAILHNYKATNLTLNNILNATSTDGYLCANSAGIENYHKMEKPGISIFPNPASEYAIVETDGDIRRITVSSLNGKIMLYDEVCSSPIYHIDTRHWTNGIYLLSITTDNGTTTQKMIINK